MKLNPSQFLDPPVKCTVEDSTVVILPFPYEGGVSYGRGAAGAPDAVIAASAHLELYDETLQTEPYRVGIATLSPPEIPSSPCAMIETIYRSSLALLELDKFVVVIGGDHSISSGYYRALRGKYGEVSVIQFDAHADLRDSYEDNPLSHACVMSRIREWTTHTLQIGIRSISTEEATRIREERIRLVTMDDYRRGTVDIRSMISSLPDPVFVTLDVDVFDWSVIASTGTPEPGGFRWYEMIDLLDVVFDQKDVRGFDVVELAYDEHDRNSPFAVAKLIYKMIGMKFKDSL